MSGGVEHREAAGRWVVSEGTADFSTPVRSRVRPRAKGFPVAAALSDSLKQILDSPVFVTVATIQPDGSPQVSPVWVKRDGDDLLFSTTVDRRKTKNMRRDPRVTVVVQPSDAPYSYAEVRGTAALESEGAQALIDELSQKYVGKDYRDFNPQSAQDAERVVVRVSPRKVVGRV